MSISKSVFGKLDNGTVIDLYTITNKSGASVSLQTLGAGIQSIKVPDKNGNLADVVLGFDNPQAYKIPTTAIRALLSADGQTESAMQNSHSRVSNTTLRKIRAHGHFTAAADSALHRGRLTTQTTTALHLSAFRPTVRTASAAISQ